MLAILFGYRASLSWEKALILKLAFETDEGVFFINLAWSYAYFSLEKNLCLFFFLILIPLN